MKKLILTTLTSMAAVAAFAQGTVNFVNDGVNLTSPPDRFIRFARGASAGNAYGTNLARAVGTQYAVQLYYGASTAAEGSLIPLTAAPANLRASTSASAGIWINGGSRTFSAGAEGATLNLQVRVWDINFGATYEAAVANANNSSSVGKSAIFTYLVPPSTAAPGAFLLANFTTFTIDNIPEPASFALAGLGAAALLIFRRRK
jgi:hypothetical protein